MHRHLIASGYLEAAATMERECNVGLTQWIAADNIDLPYVLNDFEEYFEFKFQKKPVLVRRNPDHDEEGQRAKLPHGRLPKINSASVKDVKSTGLTPSMDRRVGQGKPPKAEGKDDLSFEVAGKLIEAKPRQK